MGQPHPRPPRARPHPRRRDDDRAARPGRRQRGRHGDGGAPRARPVRPGPPAGESPFDHTIWCFASDGDIEEGIQAEAASLAGHQQLGNLVLLYDDNHISIEGDTKVAFSEDVGARYEAYGWHVQHVADVNDVPALYDAFVAARDERDRPSLIVVRSIIAWPAPHAQNTGKAHGSALGAEEVAETKKVLGFDPDRSFFVPDDVLGHVREVIDRGRALHAEWQQQFDAWAKAHPDRSRELVRMQERRLPEGFREAIPTFEAGKSMATRKASGTVINAIAPLLPGAVGRVGRPRREQPHRHRRRRRLPPGGARRVAVRPGPALRHPRARDGRDP